MKPSTPVFALTSLVAVSCAASHHPASGEPQAPAVAVHVATAHLAKTDAGHRVPGTVRGRATAALTSKTVGYVRAINVKAGDVVKQGDVIATLESNDLDAGAMRARASLSQALSAKDESGGSLAAARVAESNAKTTRDRLAALVKQGSATQSQLDDAEAAYRQAEAMRSAAESRTTRAGAAIDEAHAAVAEVDARLGYTRIKAPFSGRVIERDLDPGVLAAPGATIVVIEQEGALRVEAAVDAMWAARLHLDDAAKIDVDGAKAVLTGKIVEIVPSVDVLSRSLTVKVELPADTASMQPGTFARVTFADEPKERLLVPSVAIRPLGALDRVLVVTRADDGDLARLRMVTLGERFGDDIEVLSGLSAGEKVITETTTLRDGAKVTVTP